MTGSTPFHVPRPGAALIKEARAARHAAQRNEQEERVKAHSLAAETSADLTVPEPALRHQVVAREASCSMTPTHRRETIGPDTVF
jgi:hypothetical protein